MQKEVAQKNLNFHSRFFHLNNNNALLREVRTLSRVHYFAPENMIQIDKKRVAEGCGNPFCNLTSINIKRTFQSFALNQV